MTLPCGHEPHEHQDPDVNEAYGFITDGFLNLLIAVKEDSTEEAIAALEMLNEGTFRVALHLLAGGDMPSERGSLTVVSNN